MSLIGLILLIIHYNLRTVVKNAKRKTVISIIMKIGFKNPSDVYYKIC